MLGRDLKEEQIKKLSSKRLGFCERGGPITDKAVDVSIPDSLAGEKVSHCGVKGFMVDEVREFTTEEGLKTAIHCSHVACLEITDSPVHMHFETTETYVILKGEGKMLLGDKVIDVHEGSVMVIPPHNRHGLMSTSDKPVKVLMTFSPGLAPKEHEAFRDEVSMTSTASEVIAKL